MRFLNLQSSFFSLIVFGLLASCSTGMKVTSDKSSGTDFTQYKTFAWVLEGDTTLPHRRDDILYAGLIEHSSNTELKKHGMTLNANDPDVFMTFDTKVDDRIEYVQSPTVSVGVGYGGPGYYVGGSAPVAGGKISERPYQEGMLVIEMFDARTKKLVWYGSAHKDIDNSTDIGKVINDAVYYIFTKFPVKK
ncbi:MAG: DUF4136 domain-containing protein [Flammeovirgaceae bacterium]|nr:DUF4136 domain-containing protein [Flammeovirgaceae bacterium]